MTRALPFVLLVLVVHGAHARADVIGPDWHPPRCPELACPPGSAPLGAGSHSGCSPGCGASRTCDTDADCAAMGEGATCIETRFCIDTVVGHLGPRSIVRGACDAEGSCGSTDAIGAGETPCSITRRCAIGTSQRAAAPAEAPPSAPPAASPSATRAPEAPAESPSETAPARSSSGCAVGPARAGSTGWPLALLASALVIAHSARRREK